MSVIAPIDPVQLTAELMRCASVTPETGGAFEILERALTPMGFTTHRAPRGGVDNLIALRGAGAPVFGFSGHIDVAPPGDAASWRFDPFSATEADGALWGRGAVDMKSGVAAFIAALSRYLAAGEGGDFPGALALLITGDEEGPSVDGTRAILDWLRRHDQRLDFCLVGEPTSVAEIGDVMKIGRRGSLSAQIIVRGEQGHTAYPHHARNPLPALVRLLDRLARAELDQGSTHFEPSTLQLTTVDVGNPATNVIPAEARAALGVRFNDQHESKTLLAWIDGHARKVEAEFDVEIEMRPRLSGEAFLTSPGPLADLIAAAVEIETGRQPDMTTGGGTSDARFIKDVCPVVEFGLVGDTMHQVDERVSVDQIERLTRIYRQILRRLPSLPADGP